MGAHILIVNSETFISTRDSGIYTVRLPSGGARTDLSLESIKADLLAIRKGDTIFFYELQGGFRGVYEVIDGPFDDYSILIKPKMYFEVPVSEARALHDTTDPGDLWNYMYKKTLQRGRAITHLTPEEEEKMIRLLMKANDGESKPPKTVIPQKKRKLMEAEILKKSGDPTKVKWEKVLEKWFIANIDDLDNKEMHKLLGPTEDIEWFANYVPCSIMGGNFDIVCFHSKKMPDGKKVRYKISLIELKMGDVDVTTLKQADGYKKSLAQNLANSDEEMIQIILVGARIKSGVKELVSKMINRARPPMLVEYKVEDDKIKLNLVN